MTKRSFLVEYKQYYMRGTSWISYIFQLGIISANAKLFEDFFKIWLGLSVTQVIIIGTVGYVSFGVVIGYLDFKYGVWKMENDFGWEATPKAKKMLESIRKIEEKVCGEPQL
jgi:hypothetical protein